MKKRAFYHTATLLGVTLAINFGCAHQTPQAAVERDQLTTTQPVRRVAFMIPGVFGDGVWYDGMINAGKAAGDSTGTVEWGSSKPLFFQNFSDPDVHAEAEKKLAAAIDATPASQQIDIIAHSAGCGVTLGALARCHRRVSTVVLLAPSVSPWYKLDAALSHVDNKLYSFYSSRDTTFLKWRTGNFGTYDNVKSYAAGYSGFEAHDPKLVQIAYDPKWESLGNNGGHDGWLAEKWLLTEVSPLLGAHDDARR